MTIRTSLAAALVASSALLSPMALADSAPATPSAPTLEDQFRDPPASARPRVWWHWMNGNITKDGIAKDLAWMKSVGIGGVQNFDAAMATPQIVDKRLVYMTPAWKDAFHFAASEADRLGLELAIAASPGWSETGGPWVAPADGLKKIVWSETVMQGGQRRALPLPPPPTITGPFQTEHMPADIGEMLAPSGGPAKVDPSYYADVAVLAMPTKPAPPLPRPIYTNGDGLVLDGAALSDGDLETVVSLPHAATPPVIIATYPQPQTIRSAQLFVPGAAVMFFGASLKPRLEASQDGKAWTAIADMPASAVPTTISFAPVTARAFRLVLAPNTDVSNANMAPAPGVDAGALFGAMAAAAKAPLRVGDFQLFGEARIDRAEVKAGFDIEPDYYTLSHGVAEAAGIAPANVLDLTAHLRPDGTLDWTPPPGQWRVLRLGYSLLGTTNHPAPAEATGLEVDKFDGAAVRRYLEHYLGMYQDASGGMMGTHGVRALLTDSIEVGAANWTPLMVAHFKSQHGYDPTPWLPTLAGIIIGNRADSDRFLYDFRATLADLMANQHYATVAQVAHEHGLKLYGEALENGRPSLGDDLDMRRFTDIPMSAMWAHEHGAANRFTYIADIKGAASIAHIYGQNLVAAESMTSSLRFWDDAPRTLKHIIDLEFASGVNRPVIHTSVHQPVDDKKPGLSLFIFGQYFTRHEAWAPLAKPWVDYIARNALMLQQGRNVADVAYFYGEDQPLVSMFQEKPITDAPSANAFDFVNPTVLTRAMSNDGDALVTPGGARYRAIYLGGSSRKMTLPTLRRLAALVEGGANVIGPRPEGAPGLGADGGAYGALLDRLWPAGATSTRVGKGRVIASTEIDASLRQIGIAPDFTFAGARADGEIRFVHRKLSDGDSYFLTNQQTRPEAGEAHFHVTGKVPELWHAETGSFEAVSYRIVGGETIVPLTLAGDESVHVVLRKAARADAQTITAPAPVTIANLDDNWQVSFPQGLGAPAAISLPKLAPLNENAEAGVKYFGGVATYTRDFAKPHGWHLGQKLWLDLGDVREVAEVSLNGKLVGTLWHAPYRLDVSGAAKAGVNHISIRVGNLWVNRLIGDVQPGASKVAWTAMTTYRADAPLRPSGLIGPVTLGQ